MPSALLRRVRHVLRAVRNRRARRQAASNECLVRGTARAAHCASRTHGPHAALMRCLPLQLRWELLCRWLGLLRPAGCGGLRGWCVAVLALDSRTRSRGAPPPHAFTLAAPPRFRSSDLAAAALPVPPEHSSPVGHAHVLRLRGARRLCAARPRSSLPSLLRGHCAAGLRLRSQDAVALCFCEGCSLCQELNEVDLRALAAQGVGGQPGFVVTTVPVGGPGVTYTMPPEVAKM